MMPAAAKQVAPQASQYSGGLHENNFMPKPGATMSATDQVRADTPR